MDKTQFKFSISASFSAVSAGACVYNLQNSGSPTLSSLEAGLAVYMFLLAVREAIADNLGNNYLNLQTKNPTVQDQKRSPSL